MTTDEAIAILQALIDEIPAISKAGRLSREHQRWLQNALFEVPRIFGRDSGVLSNLRQVPWGIPSGTNFRVPVEADPRKFVDDLHERYFQRDLKLAQGILESGMDQLRRVGLEEVRRESGHTVSRNAKKVFITHGHAEDVLRRVEDFVRALGFEPVVVKREPSLGKAVDDLVEEKMSGCEAQVILATADDEVDGKHQPRMNVIHEVGLGQRMFPDKMIYLKESGCEFPSNIGPKVWETFERGDLAPAFEKIAKELRGMNLI
jgi:predicted nucleotide-binding protein